MCSNWHVQKTVSERLSLGVHYLLKQGKWLILDRNLSAINYFFFFFKSWLHTFELWAWCMWSDSSFVFCFVFVFVFVFVFFCFLWLHLWHTEVPRLGVESELQLPAYTTATATQELSCICDLQHRSQQCWIADPLSKAKDWTSVLMDTTWFCSCCATTGTPSSFVFVLYCVNWNVCECWKYRGNRSLYFHIM